MTMDHKFISRRDGEILAAMIQVLHVLSLLLIYVSAPTLKYMVTKKKYNYERNNVLFSCVMCKVKFVSLSKPDTS
jgi:hypothetical protein